MKRILDHQSTIKGVHFRLVSYYFDNGTFQGSEVEVSQPRCGKKVIFSSISKQEAEESYKNAIVEQITSDLKQN